MTIRRLAAILTADVVGYSRLMQRDETGTLAALTRWRQSILEPLVAEGDGRIVKLLGDGVLVEFASAVNAVQCALAVQDRMAQAEEARSDCQIVVRIGINLGDVIVEGDDLYGDGVNVAARLQAIAEPGGICVSAKVRDEMEGKLAALFEDRGEQELKNIGQPVRVFAVRAGAADGSTTGPGRQDEKASIAVLPFTNMSGDPEQQYFSDGVTEDIITELQRFRTLFVIARNSSFQYRNASDVKRVGHDLGARYIVEGSVRRSGQRLRVTAQLIETEGGTHLWAERYDRDMVDVFAVQDEITRSIVMGLRLIVGGAEEKRARLKGPAQMAAYDYLLQAREFFFRFTREANSEARTLVLKGLQHDRDYAHAWSYLAWCHVQDFRRSWSDDPDQSFALAMEAAKKALALDPRDYFNHWPIAFLLVYSRKHDEGIGEYQKALALNPNDSQLLDDFAEALCLAGRPEDAIAQSQLAMRLDPLHPDWFYGTLGFAYYQMRKYEDAITAMAKMINTPGGMWLFARAAAYAQLGRAKEAEETMTEYLRQRPGRTVRKESMYPFRNPADLEHLLDGLRKAGMPESG